MTTKKAGLIIVVLLCSIGSFAQSVKLMTYNIRLDVAIDGDHDWTHRKDFFTAQFNFMSRIFLECREPSPTR